MKRNGSGFLLMSKYPLLPFLSMNSSESRNSFPFQNSLLTVLPLGVGVSIFLEKAFVVK